MAPDPAAEGRRMQASFPRLEYPPLRDVGLRTPLQWLHGKRRADGAGKLWRIHDGLYDLADFAASHPGGADWITLTQGTDITEAFETHHLDAAAAEALLPRFRVREAPTPRATPFTFHPDGFYRTLKSKVATTLRALPEGAAARAAERSDRVTDALLLALAVLAPLSARLWSCAGAAPATLAAAAATVGAAVSLSSLTVAAHNYLHRRDSWRMYLFNLSGMSYLEWRVSHALSHHLHTNTALDVELSMLEPWLQFLPRRDKPLWAQGAAIYFVIIYPFVMIGLMVKGWLALVLNLEGRREVARAADLLPLAPVAWCACAGGTGAAHALAAWLLVLLLAGLLFMLVGLTAGHHGNTNFFEGDIPRSETLDWGIHQLDTMVEREEYIGDHFRSLTRFGDHALHHLFPTLDHALLPLLYPVLLEHCDKFDQRLRLCSQGAALLAHCRQLARRRPHDFSKQPPLLQRL